MVKMQSKVLFTSHTANFQKFNRPFMRLFLDKGWTVHYASMGEESIQDCDKSFTLPFSRSPFSLSNITAYIQLKKIINSEHYDIIHTHTPVGSVITRLAARKARKSGTRVVYTAHGFHFYKGAPLKNWLLWYPVEKIMARYTDTLITINKEDYERAKNKFKTDVCYVPGVGVDPKKFDISLSAAEKRKLRGEFGIKENDFVIIYVAELNHNKNQLWLVKAVKSFLLKHPDAHLILPGQDSLNGKLHKLVDELQLNNQVHLPGYRKDIPALMTISNMAISASLREGLPVNIMEAMYRGLPVVATNCRGNRDLLANYDDGHLFDINDRDCLIAHIQRIYMNTSKRKKTSGADLSGYSLKNIINKMRSLYGIDIKKSEKMNVLMVIGGLDRGGAEMLVANTVKYIDKSKYNVLIACFSEYTVYDNRYLHQTELEAQGVHIIKVYNDRFAHPVRFIRRIMGIIKANNIEIVHTHIDFMSSQILIAAYMSGVKKRIAHSHSTASPKVTNVGSKGIEATLKRIVRILATDRIACGDESGRWLFGNKSFTVVNNGIELEKFVYSDKNRDQIRREYNIGDSDLVIINVGRLAEVKNQSFLLEVFSKVIRKEPNSNLFIIGQGDLHDSLVNKSRELGVEDRVNILSSDEVYKYYSAADIFVMPSLFEGFPFTAVEAQANGLPCVFSRNISSEVKLSDGAKFLELKRGSSYWAEEIMKYKALRREEAYSGNLADYDIKVTAKKIESIYNT